MHLLLFGQTLQGFQDAVCTRIHRDRGAIAPGDDSVLIDDEERALRNSLRASVRAAPRRYRLLGTIPFFFFAPRNPAVVLSLLDLTFSNSFLDSDMTSASLALTRCLISRSSPVSGMSSPPQQRELMIFVRCLLRTRPCPCWQSLSGFCVPALDIDSSYLDGLTTDAVPSVKFRPGFIMWFLAKLGECSAQPLRFLHLVSLEVVAHFIDALAICRGVSIREKV
jgi:hypothetical protein